MTKKFTFVAIFALFLAVGCVSSRQDYPSVVAPGVYPPANNHEVEIVSGYGPQGPYQHTKEVKSAKDGGQVALEIEKIRSNERIERDRAKADRARAYAAAAPVLTPYGFLPGGTYPYYDGGVYYSTGSGGYNTTYQTRPGWPTIPSSGSGGRNAPYQTSPGAAPITIGSASGGQNVPWSGGSVGTAPTFPTGSGGQNVPWQAGSGNTAPPPPSGSGGRNTTWRSN